MILLEKWPCPLLLFSFRCTVSLCSYPEVYAIMQGLSLATYVLGCMVGQTSCSESWCKL
jgi:hypothetical protein